MESFAEDLQLSNAGKDQGHQAFQEFLLAGERNIVAGLKRPGAEAAFARMFSTLADNRQQALSGYFKRQAQLDLSQRVGLMGAFVKLDIADALTQGTGRRINPPSPSIRSELDALGPSKFGGLGSPFKTITGAVQDAITDATEMKLVGNAGAKAPAKNSAVRFVDLLLHEITVENSQDDSFFQNDTDEVTLGVTMLNEVGAVSTINHNLGRIEEGHSKRFVKPLTLGSIPVANNVKGFPRSYYFKVDAVDRDDGGYNDLLQAGAKYIKEKVTEELIAAGLIKGGAALGIPIPPVIANYLASYMKSWFDDLIDWLTSLFHNDDDILGSRVRLVRLGGPFFELVERSLFGATKRLHSDKGPLVGSPFTWTFSGADGRWKTQMRVRLR